jgi:hypothetical protein
LTAVGCGRDRYEPLPSFGLDANLPDATLDARGLDAPGLDARGLDAPLLDARSSRDANADANGPPPALRPEMPRDNANFGDDVASDGVRFAVSSAQSGGRLVVLGELDGTWVVELDTAPRRASSSGFRVALSGRHAFLGSWQAGALGGLVERWERVGGTWTYAEDLVDPTGRASEFFGSNIAACGDRLFVGAPGRERGAQARDTGAVHVFSAGAAWDLTATIEPPVASGQEFGTEFACGGDLVAIMDGDTVRIYALSAGSWALETSITPLPGEYVCDLTLGDGTMLAAGFCSTPGDRQEGRVLTYERLAAGSWVSAGELPRPAIAGSQFGISLALAGETLLVGADGWLLTGASLDGAVYQYRRVGGAWTRIASTYVERGLDGRFGYAVAIASGHGAGGAPWTNLGGLNRAGEVRVWPLAP